MEHHIDIGIWRQKCDERLEKLKHDEKMKKDKAKEAIPAEQEECQWAKEILAPELCKAIRDKDTVIFVSTLGILCRDQKLCVSEIMDQVTRAGNTILHLAASSGSTEIVELVADHYPQLLTRRNIKGDTVLHVAARTRKSFLINIILYSYCKHYSGEELCKMKDKYGNTALHDAVMASCVDEVSLLYSADEEVAHYLNKEGKSPLYLAVESRNIDVLDLFLLRASFHNVERHQGNCPLHAAILGTNSGVTTKDSVCLPEGGCRPMNTCMQFTQPKKKLARRIINSNSELLELLLEKRPELLYQRDQKGDHPLHWAASVGHLWCVQKLLREDPLIALEWNTKGYLPIHVACKRGYVEVVKEIVQQEWLDPKDLLNRKGQNILHIAAKNGKDRVVSYILRHNKKLGELLNERDENGNSPLHLASKYLHPKVLLLLTTQKRTVDVVNLVNNEGLTARDIVLLRREVPTTFRELLSSSILYSAGATLSEKGTRIMKNRHAQPPQMEWLKDRISTLMLVAILVATVSFAAGFTMPGGYNSSDDNPERKGMATLLNRKMFQLYTICDVVAMYSSTIGSFILLYMGTVR